MHIKLGTILRDAPDLYCVGFFGGFKASSAIVAAIDAFYSAVGFFRMEEGVLRGFSISF